MKLKRVAGFGAVVVVLAMAAFLVAYWRSDNACSEPAAALARPMKAVTYCDYGTAETLRYGDVEKPVPADDEVLVHVRNAAANPLDWHYMRGTPYLMRMGTGLRRPETIRLGVDFAGTVEAVGKGVTRFKPGEEVFGGRTGAFAEYVVVKQDRAIVAKPANLSFEQAAGVGVAAITALQGLRDGGKLKAGQTVLINGASGGVGTFAVQIAKTMGANVTGVCSTRNVELVRSLGADQVIDYKTSDYTQGDQEYDVILDNVGNRSLSENRRVLKPDGHYVLIGGGGPDDGRWIGPMIKPVGAAVTSWFVPQHMGMVLADLNQKDLTVLADLMAAGKVTPVIDRIYPLAELPDAIRYLESGRARGKVVITVP
ncbi:NAD(P)-dependent alcohol dehydrogenase [Lysobacter sp. GCM10012299]|uniref:NAD(P)-dependent alcohol dehydrogenase n=1 Tax=Lysobacter sp. GCM10012299 TaxID=3317333 RepID=UPI00360C0B33